MTQPSVLIIDDDLAFGELTQRRLQRMNLRVKFHPRGEGAMAQIVAEEFDLIILDVNMPGVSGPQLLEMLRTSNRDAKVLLYSSLSASELRAVASAHNADRYLPKSVPGKDLEVYVSELIGARSMSSGLTNLRSADE